MSRLELCMGCMKPKAEPNVACPHCGYCNQPRNPIVLPYQAVLNNKFLIGRILGKPGGFGITYLAWDLVLQTTVAIKEYFPNNLATRSPDHSTIVLNDGTGQEQFDYGLKQFLQEARTLAQFGHPNVVRIREYFEQNNTAYLVMDYYEGISLDEFVRRKGGKIAEQLAFQLLLPILDGLREVHHKQILHRDIKPSNIYLTKSNSPILLDFGAARYAMGKRSQSLSVILTEGFAPFEQYLSEPGEQLGPWSDIYACGATLYLITTGVMPGNAISRYRQDELLSPIQITPTLTSKFSRAVMAALAMDHEQRPQTVQEFQNLLLVSEAVHSPYAFNVTTDISDQTEGIAKERHASSDTEKTGAMPTRPSHSKPKPKPNSSIRCPHCKGHNPLPTAQNYGQALCQYCGKQLNAKPGRVLPNLFWAMLVLLPFLTTAGLFIYRSKGTPIPPKATKNNNRSTTFDQVADIQADNKHVQKTELGSERTPAASQLTLEQQPKPTLEQPEIRSDITAIQKQNVPALPPPTTSVTQDISPPPHSRVPPDSHRLPPAAPPFAIAACAGQRQGSSCSIAGKGIHGTCHSVRGQLACIPEGMPTPPPF